MLSMKRQQTFMVKGQILNNFAFSGHIIFVATTQLCCCSTKVAIDCAHKWTWLYSNKTYSQTLKFDFHMQYCFLLPFFQSLKYVKYVPSLQAVQKQAMCHIWPTSYILPTLGLNEKKNCKSHIFPVYLIFLPLIKT